MKKGPWLLLHGETDVAVRWEAQRGIDSALVVGVDGTGTRIPASQMPEQKRTRRERGAVYEAVAQGLPRCAKVNYRVEPFERGWAHDFRVPPRPGEFCPDGNRVLVYGDSRTDHAAHKRVIDDIEKERYDLLVNIGDIIEYPTEPADWEQFFTIEKQLLGSAILAIVAGNHEGWRDKKLGAALMRRYFRSGGAGGTGHYSFDLGVVHFAVVDVTFGSSLDGKGMKWLKKDLAEVPSGRYKLIVIHEPPYTFGAHEPGKALKRLRKVASGFHVSAVLAGHMHSYEHFLAEGTHYVNVGGTGAPLHEPLSHVVEKERHLLVKTAKVHHFLVLETDDDGLRFRVHDATNGRVLDEWTVEAPGTGGKK